MRDRSHEEAMVERFRKDPAYAIDLLNDVLEDGNQEELIYFLPLISAALGDEYLVPAQSAPVLPPDVVSALRKLSEMLRPMKLRLQVAQMEPVL